MKPSITKLVDAILKRLEEQPEVAATEGGIRNWLAGQGYKKRDIDAAIKLVAPRFAVYAEVQTHDPRTARALTMYEEFKLTSEARDALARLEYYSLIDAVEREMILDRLSHFDGEVGLDELDYLLAWVVCGGRDVESQQAIYSVMEGEGTAFH